MSRTMYLDLGNTRLKWMHEEGQACSVMHALNHGRTDLLSKLDGAWETEPKPDQLWLASVADSAVLEQLMEWLQNNWGLMPGIMQVSSRDCGVSCGYKEPGQLGVDRWAAVIAAHARWPEGVCVVDCGTAMTLDVIDGGGRHLGGYILPGVGAMQKALLQDTAMDPKEEKVSLGLEWGDSTWACIDLGTRNAMQALIEQTIERLQAAGACDPALVITGGDAELITPYLQIDHRYCEDLVLQGIRLYAKERDR